ncbi:integrase [Streptomyces albidoflavus]|uniref:integrase n=1 Tax=Streptomyces albidoflavus TaxID=1886 RepID=UPI0033DC14DA
MAEAPGPTAQRGMSVEELLALPVAFSLDVSNRALAVGRTKGFDLARRGEYPVPLIKIGNTYRVSRASLLDLLGVADNSEAAAVAPAAASSEQTTQPA